ncbi:MAG: DUF6160 family protein [Bermanella sp.]
MKGFQKLALVTAIAAAPFAAQAELKAMDDALLSEMTGQAGVTIDVDLQMTIENIVYVDSDGSGATTLVSAATGQYDTNGDAAVDGGFDSSGVAEAVTQDVFGTKGAVTISDLKMGSLDASGALIGAASIKGVTIDVDGTDGLVIGIGQIGDTSGNGIDISVASITVGNGGGQLAVLAAKTTAAGTEIPGLIAATATTGVTDAASGAAYLADPSNSGDGFWDAAVGNITTAAQNAGLAAQSGNIGGLVIENFKNYVEDDTVATYNDLFGMAIMDSSGVVDGVTGVSAGAGRYIQAEIKIAGTGNAALGTSGVKIDAAIGGGMDKMAWVTGEDTNADTVADAFHEVGVRDFAFFGSSDADGDGITDTLEAMEISVTIDVVDHESWNNATPGTVDVAALHISDMVVKGSIQLGDIYMSSTTASVSEQSLGGVLIKNIDMTGTDVYIYGH